MPDDLVIARALGIDPNDPDVKLAKQQIKLDSAWIADIVAIRKQRFPDVNAFADLIGWESHDVIRFEIYPDTASLENVRLYSHAVGVMTRHHVTPIETSH